MGSKDIGVPFIIVLMINIISTYLLSIQIIDFITLIFIIIGSIVIIIIIGFQLKINKIKEELDNQKTEQQKLNEKLKIYDRLSKIAKRLNIWAEKMIL